MCFSGLRVKHLKSMFVVEAQEHLGFTSDLPVVLSVTTASWVLRCSWVSLGDVMNARFFLANIRGFEFHLFLWKNSEVLKVSRQHVDRTVFLNDQNCYWQSICSEEIVHLRFFSDGRIGFRSHLWWALNLQDLFLTRPFFRWIVVLQHFASLFENYEQRIFASRNRSCRTSPGLSCDDGRCLSHRCVSPASVSQHAGRFCVHRLFLRIITFQASIVRRTEF